MLILPQWPCSRIDFTLSKLASPSRNNERESRDSGTFVLFQRTVFSVPATLIFTDLANFILAARSGLEVNAFASCVVFASMLATALRCYHDGMREKYICCTSQNTEQHQRQIHCYFVLDYTFVLCRGSFCWRFNFAAVSCKVAFFSPTLTIWNKTKRCLCTFCVFDFLAVCK